MNTKLSMILYGKPGSGKTTFAAAIPNSLLIDCENGARFVKDKNSTIFPVEDWETLTKGGMEKLLKEIEAHDTIIVDTISSLCEMVRRHTKKLPALAKSTKSDGSPSLAGWGWVGSTVIDFINFLVRKDKNIIILAHEKHFDQEDVEKKAKKGIIIEHTTIPSTTPTSCASKIAAMVDLVAYIVHDRQGNYQIFCDQSNETHLLKDRSGMLQKDKIEPTFEALQDKIFNQ